MLIQVLGVGCPKCDEAARLVRETLARLEVNAQCEKVSDLRAIMQMGVLSTPAVAIDGKVRCSGRIPTEAELEYWLAEAARS